MRLINVLALVGFASAAPTATDTQARSAREVQAIQERQGGGQTVIGTIQSAIAELQSATNTNVGAIKLVIEETRGSVETDVLVRVEAVVKANFERIASAFRAAGATILGATTVAGGNLQILIKGLTTQQIKEINEALKAAVTVISNLEASLDASVTGADTAIRDLINAELKALQESIDPFVKPLSKFVADIQNIRGEASAGVTGLGEAIRVLGEIVKRLVAGVGLSAVNLSVAGDGLAKAVKGAAKILNLGA